MSDAEPFDPKPLCGWIGADDKQRLIASRMPTLARACPRLMSGPTGQVLLYKVMQQQWTDPDYPAQQIGDCTGFGNDHCLDLLQCTEAYLDDIPLPAVHESCTEFAYAVGREVAGILGRQDGGYGAAVVKGMATIGTLPRGAVGPYSGRRAKEWGRTGAPDAMKTLAAPYKIAAYAGITTNDEAIASLNNGLPFSICTGLGFTMTRDADGFCSREGSWGHCMCVSGYRTDKPGFLVQQSWGRNRPAGPCALGQPDWSFWITPTDMSSILSEGDSWALSGSKGFARQGLPRELRYHPKG